VPGSLAPLEALAPKQPPTRELIAAVTQDYLTKVSEAQRTLDTYLVDPTQIVESVLRVELANVADAARRFSSLFGE